MVILISAGSGDEIIENEIWPIVKGIEENSVKYFEIDVNYEISVVQIFQWIDDKIGEGDN